jgi:uncharacterized surface anchored protein
VESNNGSIFGSVKDDEGIALANVTVQLRDASDTIVRTTTTSGAGLYDFKNLEPGNYKVVEINPVGYDTNISDGDTSSDGDVDDLNLNPDNVILVTLEQPSEDDKNNDFVDSNKGSISGSVVDDQGKPLSDVVLTLKKGTTTVATTTWECA